MSSNKIIYTLTDEAPALATASFLPLLKVFTNAVGIEIETRDISLAARIIATFPEKLTDKQKIDDALAELGELAKQPNANIIKLPNISASIPQLKAAITELQAHGYDVPNYPEDAFNDTLNIIKNRYATVLGSAVNPVLREGNSDRRAPGSVKQFAKNNPHSMGVWSKNSKSKVASMSTGDFYSSELSTVIRKDGTINIEFVAEDGKVSVLKANIPVLKDEIVDASLLSKNALRQFFKDTIADAKENDVLLSIHMKATMMKVSDPIIFGHAVTVYYQTVFDKYKNTFEKLGVTSNNGIGDVYSKISSLSDKKQKQIIADIEACYDVQPELAMVDSDKGITNLHVPSNVIVDASMPAAIRSSGKMWGADGKLKDTFAMIPDRCYAGIYQKTIDFCKLHGAFDPTTMGTVPNVGLMAQKAEEYGSHDKTFEMVANGTVSVTDEEGNILLQHKVKQGDIWRACQAKDAPIKNWVKLAVTRAKAMQVPTIFWLDEKRAHDRKLIEKVIAYLAELDTDGLDIQIMSPDDAIQFSLERIIQGKDTISVTGNVLRDYLTDLFPILELGTSAKMLSIVPLMNGGGLFETGAGGSAPKHVQQFTSSNHLRWDSLGEFLAVCVSLEHMAEKYENADAKMLSKTLDLATADFLQNNKSPSRKVGELDNRGSHFYLVMYWAKRLAEQDENVKLKKSFVVLAKALSNNENVIMDELKKVQNKTVDLGGYFHLNSKMVSDVMRPSETLNRLMSEFK